ncbi:MAG: protein kinase [Candidatus Geothermarchaeota archaeon]
MSAITSTTLYLHEESWRNENVRSKLTRILTYPRYDEELAYSRLTVLKNTGVEAIILSGGVQIDRLQILGKGTNALVVKGLYKGSLVAIKILRVDAHRASLENEATILNYISNTNISPRVLSSSNWFIVMEYIEGKPLETFLDEIFTLTKGELDNFLKNLLDKLYILDSCSVDHGELTNPRKHIIVLPNLHTKVIDYESASINRKPKNLTSVLQFLFIRSKVAEYLRNLYQIDKNTLIVLLRNYKRSGYSKEGYLRILEHLGIQT